MISDPRNLLLGNNRLTLFPMGGGHMAPPAENRPLSVEKIKIFKNERSENALPTPRNPT